MRCEPPHSPQVVILVKFVSNILKF